jgi:3',5'-cyclic-AMP phosphodiesterase
MNTALLAELLAPLTMPVYLAAGNHDDRGALQRAFPQHAYLAGDDPFIQYAVDDFDVRLLVLDTTIPGEPGGALCAQRLQWLDRALRASQCPTIVAQHHPPLATGLTMMDEMGLADPAGEESVIAHHPHVQCVIGGHYHRTAQARFAGTVASICPSTAHQLALNLTQREYRVRVRAFGLPVASLERVADRDAHRASRGLSGLGHGRLSDPATNAMTPA